MIALIASGVVLGLNAGVSPGPLLTLVITESLRGGWPAGFRVSLAPLITDSLIISLSLLVMAPLPPWGLAAISVVGGLLIVWMGWEAARTPPPAVAEVAATGPAAGPLWKGVGTNLLNPHAYLFWLTAGGPLLKSALAQHGIGGPLTFLVSFFALLIGSKMVIALGVSRGRRFLQGRAYRLTLGLSGAALAVFGLYRVYEGVRGLL
ncbi:MAG: LysE family translocator [Bacillota bacterium]